MSQPEGLEVDVALLTLLRQQQRGAEVAADHEEDVDALRHHTFE